MTEFSLIGVVSGFFLASFAALLLAYQSRWVVAHPQHILIALLAVTILAAHSLFGTDPPHLRIRIDPSSEPLLAQHDPVAELYQEAVRDFGHDEIYAAAVECEEVFTRDCLGSLDGISNRVAHLEGIRGISSLVDATSLRWVESESWIEIVPLIEEVPQDSETLSLLRERALNDEVYRQTLVSTDAKAAALNVGFQKMDDAMFLASGLDAAILQILADEVGEDQSFHVAGRPHTKVHVYRGIVRDLLLLIPLAILVMAVVLWIFFRNFRGVAFPLGTALTANLWTFGIMAAQGESLTLLTGLLGPLLSRPQGAI